MVEDCVALLDHLGLGAVDVVGHSLGGHLGLMLAARAPGRVRRLVTLTAGTPDAKTLLLFDDLALLYFTMVPQDWFRILYQFLFSDPFFADEARVAAAADASTKYPFRQSAGDFARQVAALDRIGPMDLKAVRCPVLAIAGELDVLARPEAVAAMHAAIGDCRVVTIAGAAHSIHWEKPAATAAAISDFLK
jgi:aminoacrylate hydrolase